MKRFICVTSCPELDSIKETDPDYTPKIRCHCSDTRKGIVAKEEHGDYCPCGNKPIWLPTEDVLANPELRKIANIPDEGVKDKVGGK